MKKIGEWLEFIIKEEWKDRTVFSILSEEIGASKALIGQWRETNSIKRNDTLADVNHKVCSGDRLSLHVFKTEPFNVIPTEQDIAVLYEDDHLIILNKQANMNTHPNNPSDADTLANGLANYYKQHGIQTTINHIHRLDYGTSGAIIFAKHALAQAILHKDLENRIIKRTYLAAVQGKVKQKSGKIDLAIGRDRHHPTRRRVSPKGQKAITNYNVDYYDNKNNISILSLHLDTGRTHQIRVHLSHLGHPIIGDELYGGKINKMKRQALHARKIRLIHPLTKEKIEVIAPLPPDMNWLNI
ncbi:RluA family pseudouridine synthase [Metabacillus fastidiosus]|uniref:RluA family pseudouridine synthase n=1 Tax=Metabacillus fastidiosus TaxID=1458 RepID=UPI002DBB2D95|nr:RluA family pseudouridine synthase [Metabacillus fastidiosus]MEC2075576.1 RluA family pseudouridine synthase [Metabacillus fastidiosus]